MRAHKASKRGVALVAAALWVGGGAAAAGAQDSRPTTLKAPQGPASSEETERKVHALATELRRIAEKHGNDAVALQASFLIETIRAGAVGPSEVRVVGDSARHGPEFLEIKVETGLIFDADTTDVPACADQVWASIAAPVLDKMETFTLKPAGLELVFAYGRQHFSSHVEREPDLSAPQEAHTARFLIPAKMLDDLRLDRVSIDQLRASAATVLE